MNLPAINIAINKTALKGRLTGNDLERWRQDDNLTDKPPLWFSVFIGMAASLELSQGEINEILKATLPQNHVLPTTEGLEYVQVDPWVFLEPSLSADAAFKIGKMEEAQALWLKAIQAAHQARMTTAEPYRMFGNLASTAFGNGDTVLAEASLDIALRLNPNYSFGRKLLERSANGEFLQDAFKKMVNKPDKDFISKSDLETKTNTEILHKLSDFGIELGIDAFIEIARPVRDTIQKVTERVESLAKKTSALEEIDEDYVYSACEVLWDRLITLPLFETFQDILFDLEDSEPDSNLYFECIDKLAWAFNSADEAIFVYYQNYPFELSGLRYALHDMLAYEVLRESQAGVVMLSIAEKALKSGHFPDMKVADVIRRIQNGTNWEMQLNTLLTTCRKYSQAIIAGLSRGLLNMGRFQDVVDICTPILEEVLNGSLEPEDPEILSICEYLEESYTSLGNKPAIRRLAKEQLRLMELISELEKVNSRANESRLCASSYEVLKDSGLYSEVFGYEEFLKSLGISFESSEPTIDKLTTYSQHGEVKVGRNEPCPCGATKSDGTPVKYKKCHGR